jgi:hypothetical protein
MIRVHNPPQLRADCGSVEGDEALSWRRVLISLTLFLLLVVSIGIGIAVAAWPQWVHWPSVPHRYSASDDGVSHP